MRARFSEAFSRKTREEWSEVFSGSDACVAPVMDLAEAPGHPHLESRGTFVSVDGVLQPGPVPRFQVTAAGPPGVPVYPGRDTDAILSELGVDEGDISRLHASGVVR
jgi:alpha-methylacyl-CoA racemase